MRCDAKTMWLTLLGFMATIAWGAEQVVGDSYGNSRANNVEQKQLALEQYRSANFWNGRVLPTIAILSKQERNYDEDADEDEIDDDDVSGHYGLGVSRSYDTSYAPKIIQALQAQGYQSRNYGAPQIIQVPPQQGQYQVIQLQPQQQSYQPTNYGGYGYGGPTIIQLPQPISYQQPTYYSQPIQQQQPQQHPQPQQQLQPQPNYPLIYSAPISGGHQHKKKKKRKKKKIPICCCFTDICLESCDPLLDAACACDTTCCLKYNTFGCPAPVVVPPIPGRRKKVVRPAKVAAPTKVAPPTEVVYLKKFDNILLEEYYEEEKPDEEQ